ncbi:MAG: hypothetical protein K2Q97_14855 [Burkholderiaceae bacterium]|nr:hypothetical protein [Burkholderiaceae bacterium]
MAIIKCAECQKDISDTVTNCPHCGFERKAKSKSAFGCGTWVIILLVVFGFVGAMSSPSGTSSSTAEPRIDPVKAALPNVKIEKFAWRMGGFNNVMLASFTVANNNSHQVSDLEIECDLNAKSGTRIDRNTKTIYQSVPPKKSIRINDFSMGFTHSQSATAGCVIIGLRAN